MKTTTQYRHIKAVTATNTELEILLDELRKVQDPEHKMYQSWFENSDCEKWLAHIQSGYQTLTEHA